MADLGPNVNGGRCVNLRWKGLLVYGEEGTDFGKLLDAQPPCWCVKTQYCLGPDGQVAGVHECNPTRSCFKPL